MPRLQLLVVFALGIALSAPASARAQALRGKLRDADNNPISAGSITLKTEAGELAAQGTSDPNGIFHVAAPAAGTYIAEIRRIGFGPWTSGPMSLRQGITTEIEVTLSTNPVAVARVVITNTSNREFGRDGWAKRKALGLGVFLTGEQIRAQHTISVAEALRAVPGVYITDRGVPGFESFPMVRTMMGGRCLVWFLNRQPLPSIPGQPYEFQMHTLVSPDDVAGIEVYREFKEMPAEFRQMVEHRLMVDQMAVTAQPLGNGPPIQAQAAPVPSCGAVVVWSYTSW